MDLTVSMCGYNGKVITSEESTSKEESTSEEESNSEEESVHLRLQWKAK